jgi:hypothetical protein
MRIISPSAAAKSRPGRRFASHHLALRRREVAAGKEVRLEGRWAALQTRAQPGPRRVERDRAAHAEVRPQQGTRPPVDRAAVRAHDDLHLVGHA